MEEEGRQGGREERSKKMGGRAGGRGVGGRQDEDGCVGGGKGGGELGEHRLEGAQGSNLHIISAKKK